MERAIYSKNGRLISVADYVHQEGTKLDSKGLPRARAKVTCPGCDEVVHTVAETIHGRANVWAHDPNPDGPWCPIKDEGAKKYALLTPATPDPALGAALRSAFLHNWKKHWGHIQEMAPMADIHALDGFIKHADRTKFWQNVGLAEWHIPYVFLTSCEFPPRASRREWYRFMFDAKVRDYRDLWIRTTGSWRFLKMRYRPPRAGKSPGPSHYIDCDILLPDPAFLGRTFAPPHPYALRAMSTTYGA